uniref:Uncharacterized protein n=1 Tax=Rhizophora mucronata TaxID=61149 RepID=A0A2P2QH66_RHIMU
MVWSSHGMGSEPQDKS